MMRVPSFRHLLCAAKVPWARVHLDGKCTEAAQSFILSYRAFHYTTSSTAVRGSLLPLNPVRPCTSAWRPMDVVSFRFASRSAGRGEQAIPVSWKSVGATLVIAGIFWAGMAYTKKEKETGVSCLVRKNYGGVGSPCFARAMFRERQKQIGKAKIGGDWELTDMNGNPRTSKEFLGTWLLIYFGFTHCPDICPDEIEKMMKTLELLERRVKDVKFATLFITVDPARDDIAAVKRYCKDFSPRLLGLTGTQKQVSKAAKAFRVYFSAAPPDDENDYIVDHTIIIYLIDAEGKFVDYYGQTKTAEQMAEHIESHINRHKYLTL